MVTVNLVAVLVSGVIAMALGAAWYSPLLFGKLWMKLSAVDAKTMADAKKKGIAVSYAVMFAATLVMAYVLAHFMQYAGATTITRGLEAAFWLWLGFIATALIGMVLWDRKPVALYLLTAGHYLATLLVMGAILSVWK